MSPVLFCARRAGRSHASGAGWDAAGRGRGVAGGHGIAVAGPVLPGSMMAGLTATTVVPTMIVQPACARAALNGCRAGRQQTRGLGAGDDLGELTPVCLVTRLWPAPCTPGSSSWADGTAVRAAPPLCGEAARPQRAAKGDGERVRTPLHFQSIAHRGACRKTRVVPHNRRPRPELAEWGTRNACVAAGVWVPGRRGDGGRRGRHGRQRPGSQLMA
jgi:hypothetical protein